MLTNYILDVDEAVDNTLVKHTLNKSKNIKKRRKFNVFTALEGKEKVELDLYEKSNNKTKLYKGRVGEINIREVYDLIMGWISMRPNIPVQRYIDRRWNY